MADIKHLKLDTDKEAKGVWVPFDMDVQLLIASTNCPEFRKASAVLMATHRQKIRTTGLTFDERVEILKPAIAHYLLGGWRNLTENGKTVAYSPTKALELFEEIKDLPGFVLATADERDWFRADTIKESAKNS